MRISPLEPKPNTFISLENILLSKSFFFNDEFIGLYTPTFSINLPSAGYLESATTIV